MLIPITFFEDFTMKKSYLLNSLKYLDFDKKKYLFNSQIDERKSRENR